MKKGAVATETVHVATPMDIEATRDRVEHCIESFLAAKERAATGRGLVPEVPAVLRDFLAAGGKRLRPLLCVAGWYAAGGEDAPDMVIQTAAALEMYQSFALIHDDVIDNSSTRRFEPTVHRALTARHGGGGDPHHFGISAAILVGNMALTWSDELFTTAAIPLERRVAVGTLLDAMREEMHYGQYLDLMHTLGSMADDRTPMTVIRYKTSKYTVERPLHIGATLAGAGAALNDTLSRFALPLGDAFQLRDDLLGVFGDPQATGKPVVDDLREGKHTVLLAMAAQRANPVQRKELDRLVGDPELEDEGGARVREIFVATGAVAAVETMIADFSGASLSALTGSAIPPSAADVLREIAALAVERDS